MRRRPALGPAAVKGRRRAGARGKGSRRRRRRRRGRGSSRGRGSQGRLVQLARHQVVVRRVVVLLLGAMKTFQARS
jgi:hypothetical protein